MDPGLNKLLKWGIQNSNASDGTSTAEPVSANGINAEALTALMGGPSDADLMKASMEAITDPDITLDNKLIAFDNLEQLIETIDNANNLDVLGLWAPLVTQLRHDEAELRRMAAWSIGTAVQNNPKGQEQLFALKTIPTLVNLAISDPSPSVRQKAIYALSSAIRNYTPALNEALKTIPENLVGRPATEVDAGDMEVINEIMANMREHSKTTQTLS